jgi:hypothetical protein
MTEWYLLDGGQLYNSGLEGCEHFAHAALGFKELVRTTALGDRVVVHRGGVLGEGEETLAVVQNNTSDALDADGIKRILTEEPLEYGAYVLYKGDLHLVTDLPGDNKIYFKAIMRRCNYLCKWRSARGGVAEAWGVFANVTREYSDGVSKNRSMAVGNATSALFLPKNSETILLGRGDRLMIDDYEHAQSHDPDVYKISRLNLIQKSKGGSALFVYTLAETEFNASRDSRELMIAGWGEVEGGAV